jgi:hypothetical protein
MGVWGLEADCVCSLMDRRRMDRAQPRHMPVPTSEPPQDEFGSDSAMIEFSDLKSTKYK